MATPDQDKYLQDTLDIPAQNFCTPDDDGDDLDDQGVRPSEMIAGASGVQYSLGENTDQATAQGGDFAEGSRKSAAANAHDNSFGGKSAASNPMQSPNLGSSKGFAKRYGIGFLCSKYPKSWNANLDDIAGYSKPNSAFLSAFKGLNKTQQFTNPAKKDVLAGISEWVKKLKTDLKPGEQGELIVTFQGHGAHGSFFASDGNEITTPEMMALAKAAEGSRVSMTFVMDACFAGGAVPEFQNHAADAVDQRVDENVEGAGQVCSPDNHSNAEKLRDQMAQARELILFSQEVATHGDRLNDIIQTIKQNNDVAAWDDAMKENRTIIQLTESMQNQFGANMNFGNVPAMKLDQIAGAFVTVLTALNGIQPQTSFDYGEWTGAIGKFEDQISDGANRIIRILQQASRKTK